MASTTLTGNKGEWSEIYTLLRLLADGHLHLGDAELRPIEGLILPILYVLRDEDTDGVVHSYQVLENEIELALPYASSEPISISRERLRREAEQLLLAINSARETTFSVQSVMPLLAELYIEKIKAPSRSKADIRLTIRDTRMGGTPTLGFSIKSKLGSPSTLLNASLATNVAYQLSPLLQLEVIEKCNKEKGFREKLSLLTRAGGHLTYVEVPDRCFRNNLTLIDSLLPEILAESLLIYYSGQASKLADIMQLLRIKNPLNFDLEHHDFYAYKMKKLLVEIALGMTPKKPWDGQYTASGGYIIVKREGDLVGYHFYDRNLLEEYLLMNTSFDTPSTTRHKFGSIDEFGRLLLNVQIRFR
jgi:hypothetical protein